MKRGTLTTARPLLVATLLGVGLPAPHAHADDHGSVGVTASIDVGGRRFRGTEAQPDPEGRPLIGLALGFSYRHLSGHGALLRASALMDFPPETHAYSLWLVDGRYRWDFRTDRSRDGHTSYALTAGASLARASHYHVSLFGDLSEEPADPEPLDHVSVGPGLGVFVEHHTGLLAVTTGADYRVLAPIDLSVITVEHVVTLTVGVGFGFAL